MADTVKTLVEARPQVWRAFKALAAERGDSVQAALGKLVAREVGASQRAKAKKLGRSTVTKREMDKTLAEMREADRGR